MYVYITIGILQCFKKTLETMKNAETHTANPYSDDPPLIISISCERRL